ncbi:MAG: RNA polymerase sigma factor [Beijerinckiaceae bacterium]
MSDKNNFTDLFLEEMVLLLPRLWRFAVTQTRQKTLAEDLVQQTCQRALERRAQFQPGTRQDHWMFSIMSSLWKNHLRAEKLRLGIGRVEAADLWDEEQLSGIDDGLMHSRLLSAILELPVWQREVVTLVYIEELSYRQASDALSIPLGTVMSRLAAAKVALAGKLNANPDPLKKEHAQTSGSHHVKRI